MPFVLSILPLFSIAYQDFKQRAISWYWPVLLLAVSVYSGWALFGNEMFKNIAFNLAFLLVVFGSVTVYFSLKLRKLTNVFDVYVGWGDVVFLLALVPFFHPLDFVLFYSFVAIFALLVGLIMRSFNAEETIPFAGIISALMIVLFAIGWTTDTSWLMNFQFKTLLF
ncbi:MAG: hypothetical protein NT150_01690 [Bacteroidetes bacterium]|nr:hypothetical protein [Bacteroidota bacterium]